MEPNIPYSTKGGSTAHWMRRTLHLGMILIPWLYYTFHISPRVLWILLATVVLLEIIRLTLGLQLFGQRTHEVKRVSSFAWGAVSLFLVLLFTTPQFAYPIIVACAFGDPLVGELRRFHVSKILVIIIGVLFISGLWLLAWLWLGTPWWWAIIMGPLTLAAEWPNLTWIDDNALMQLVPLVVVMVFG